MVRKKNKRKKIRLVKGMHGVLISKNFLSFIPRQVGSLGIEKMFNCFELSREIYEIVRRNSANNNNACHAMISC